MGWTYAFLNSCELKSFHESYSFGVLPDNLSKLQPHQKQGVNGRWCIDEVGFDLVPCVHAHGNDVDLIIGALVSIIFLFVWIDLVSMFLVPCNRGFDHDCSSLIPLLDQFKHLSSADQYLGPSFNFDLHPSITPGISRKSWSYIASYKLLISYVFLHWFQFPRVLSCWTIKDTDIQIEYALRFNNS